MVVISTEAEENVLILYGYKNMLIFIRFCKTVFTCGLSAIFVCLHDNRHDLITCPDRDGSSKYRSGAC